MSAKDAFSFSVLIVEYQKITVWSNIYCHGCAFEQKEACEKFGIHTRSNDTHCLFCINNPNVVLPLKDHHKMSLSEHVTTIYTFFLSCGCIKKIKTRLFKGNTVYCNKHHNFVEIVDVKKKKFMPKTL